MLATFMDAAAVSEFTHQYQGLAGLTPIGLPELQHAVAWPLDAGGLLDKLYQELLRYLLLQWVSS